MPMQEEPNICYRKRLIVQKGAEFISLKTEDAVLFYTQNRLVFVIDKNEKRYIINKKMNELATELNPDSFFRANRQCIIHVDFIKSFRTYERVKLIIEISLTQMPFPVIISQENAAAFRRWICTV